MKKEARDARPVCMVKIASYCCGFDEKNCKKTMEPTHRKEAKQICAVSFLSFFFSFFLWRLPLSLSQSLTCTLDMYKIKRRAIAVAAGRFILHTLTGQQQTIVGRQAGTIKYIHMNKKENLNRRTDIINN